MSIAISEEHRALAQTVAGFLTDHQSRAQARSLLGAQTDALPDFWADLAALGLLGLHIPEEHGGSGFGLAETLVVAEQMGRQLAPGPFCPTVIASAVLAAAGPDDLRKRLLPGLADGTVIGAAALGGEVTCAGGVATGKAGVVISGHLADVLLVPAGDDVLVIEKSAGGVRADVPANLDQSRRAARISLDAAPATVLPGARGLLTDVARAVLAAEAAGIAGETTDQAAEYAKVRQQFGRPIATFQAVKHHCANMLVAAELATAAAWDAGRAGLGGGDQLSFTAAIAAARAVPAALRQRITSPIPGAPAGSVHLQGGDAPPLPAPGRGGRRGGGRRAGVDRGHRPGPPRGAPGGRDRPAPRGGADPRGDGARRGPAARPGGRGEEAGPDRVRLRDAVLAEAVGPRRRRDRAVGDRAGVRLGRDQAAQPGHHQLDHPDPDPVRQPGAGRALESARAAWTSRTVVGASCPASRAPGPIAAADQDEGHQGGGGWLINGQKVWTSGAHVSDFGLATVRTNPDAPKHQGITTMVIDMRAPGVTVRPLKMPSGNSDFNEVFFDDVFVPDAVSWFPGRSTSH